VQRAPGFPCALCFFEGRKSCTTRAFCAARMRRCAFVVPANAGTHNHRYQLSCESRRTAPLTTRAVAYGSLLSQGRRESVVRIEPTGYELPVAAGASSVAHAASRQGYEEVGCADLSPKTGLSRPMADTREADASRLAPREIVYHWGIKPRSVESLSCWRNSASFRAAWLPRRYVTWPKMALTMIKNRD
jgi:hypothetical protein